MDCADQTYRMGPDTNPYYDFVAIDADENWMRASLDDIQQHPSLTQLRHQQDDNGSPSGSNGSSIAYRADGLERSSLDQTPFPEGDLISDQFFNSYCNTSPASIDEADGMTAEQTRRSRWMENAAQGSEPDKDGRLARRQAQNREAQRAHRAKQKSKLSTLESRVKLAESNCRLLEEANQRMEDVLRNLVNDAVKVLASPARISQPGQRPSRFATS